MDILRSKALILFILFFFSTQNIIFSLGINIICKERERTALLSFKKHLKSSSNSLSSWSGENCCRWAGVVCNNRTDHVVQLQLQNLGLGGELNSSLLELKHLKHLDLSVNDFEGISLPDYLGSLQCLRYLNLSNAGFSGMIPHQLGNLSRLRYLDLNSKINNEVTKPTVVGNFEWISHLSSLQYLDLSYTNLNNASNSFYVFNMLPSLLVLRLSHCDLSGVLTSLPYVNFTSLAILDLSWNNLNSTLPEWLYNLTNLEQLDLSYNFFQGTISASIGNLTKLKFLHLSDNQFRGEIPMTMGNLCKLESLDLSSNKLSCRLPTELGRLKNLNSLVLFNNELIGNVPETLGNLLNLVELSIYGNAIEGIVSEIHFANLTNLQSLLMTSRSLVLKFSPKWVPPFQLLVAVLNTCQLGPGFPIWLRTQKNLTFLLLSMTGISGTVPTWFWDNFFSDHLNSSQPLIYPILDLSHNELYGELPRVSPHLLKLDLSNNSFSGSISTFLCNPISKYNSLYILDLSDNLLSGDLSDCWVHWTSLKYIRLGKNKITGKIQSSIGSTSRLLDLQLSNNILSGELPSSLRNCTNLYSIDLGGNGLTGILPAWLGESLLELEFLSLRSNKFYNEIPLQLCNLTSLRVLDIAHNHLRGSIPRCFDKFSAMATESSTFQSEFNKITLVMKGRELEYYSNIMTLVTSLDLSKNSLSGKIH